MIAAHHRTRLDAATVRDALGGAAIVERFGIAGRRAGREFRTRECPACGRRSSAAVAINLARGAWHCKVCGVGGDGIDLVARLAGLTAREDFPNALTLAADIAGFSANGDAATVAAIRRRNAERRAAEAATAQRERAAAR